MSEVRDMPTGAIDSTELDDRRTADKTRAAKNEANEKSALCLSGGGIRSATFCLGVLQGLAEIGWFKEFNFLSTVSGGGYIGSWLTRWRKESNINVVAKALQDSIHTPIPEIEHLRAYSSYLSPRRGLSGDLFALLGSFLRNLLLNWLVLFPLLALVAVVPLAGNALAWWTLTHAPWQLLVGLAVALAGVALAYASSDFPYRSHHQTDVSHFGLLWLLPTIASASLLVLSGYGYLLRGGKAGLGESLVIAALSGVGVWVSGSAAGVFARSFRVRVGERGRNESTLLLKRLSHCADEYRSRLGLAGAGLAGVSGAASGALIWLLLAVIGRYDARLGSLEAPNDLAWAWLSTLGVPAVLLILQVGTTMYVALALGRNEVGAREWWGRAAGYSLAFAVAWALGHLVALWMPALLLLRASAGVLAGAAGVVGLISTLGGYFGELPSLAPGKTTVSLWRVLADRAVELAAGAFALTLLVLLSFGWLRVAAGSSTVAGLGSVFEIIRSGLSTWAIGAIGAMAIALFASRWIKVNRFSLQAIYQNRLVRAYLGASRDERRPHAFTGFDPEDDLALDRASKSEPLRHVLNATLNIGSPSKEELKWQQRKAALFTFDSRRCRAFLGADAMEPYEVPTRLYADEEEGISLGRAMAVSGAAASPNMGFHTSPLVSFALTFLNIRLGAWLPNPRYAEDQEAMGRSEPGWSLGTLVAELAGRATSRSRFVNISDGGHFENLGLFDMVRRRCKRILVVDAGADPRFEFDDLENAIRKIRTDLNVDIAFDGDLPIADQGTARHHVTVGTIDYGREGRGRLVYLKPVLTGDEPTDVLRYATRSAAKGRPFPHHSTSDQFFDEAQFESYRALGYHSIVTSLRPHSEAPELEMRRPEVEGAAPALALTDEPALASEPPPSNVLEALKKGMGAAEATAKGSGMFNKLAATALAAVTIPSAAYVVTQTPEISMLFSRERWATLLPVEQVASIFLRDPNDRIMLPLFDEALGCGGDPRDCDQGTELSPAGEKLVGRLAEKLTECARHDSEFKLAVRGFSSSSKLEGGGPYANLELGDLRACRVAQVLFERLSEEGPEVEIDLRVHSWSAERPIPFAEFCDIVETDAESLAVPRTRGDDYDDGGLDRIARARIDDLIEETQIGGSGEEKGDIDIVLAILNRRVELQGDPGFGTCSISDLVRHLGARARGREGPRGPARQLLTTEVVP